MLDIEIIEGKPSTLTFLKNVIDEQIELMEQVKMDRWEKWKKGELSRGHFTAKGCEI